MSTYRERREARADRLRGWAEGREAKAAAGFERAHTMADAIPFGQPILVGHHSESRDRRYRARIVATGQRALEDARKAESMTSRAGNIEAQLDRSIYSDDVDAVDRLAERVAELEGQRERIKAYNASCRKAAKTGGNGDLLLLDDDQRADIAGLARIGGAYLRDGGAFPSYVLTNLSGNIKRNRDRLEEVRRLQERTAATDAAGGVLVEALAGGYCRVTFADKPAREVLDALRAAGFRWSRPSWVGQAAALPAEVDQ